VADVDAFWTHLKERGFDPPRPQDASWGERYFHILDPDGHELSFALRDRANPVEVIVARTEQGHGVMGVIDGSSPKGIEGPAEINARKEFLRKIGYKR
jgi:hypothetical protein